MTFVFHAEIALPVATRTAADLLIRWPVTVAQFVALTHVASAIGISFAPIAPTAKMKKKTTISKTTRMKNVLNNKGHIISYG